MHFPVFQRLCRARGPGSEGDLVNLHIDTEAADEDACLATLHAAAIEKIRLPR